MGAYRQADRLKVATPLGPDALLLERFHGTEEISRLFRFELDLLAESSTKVPFQEILGKEIQVQIQLPSGAVRYFNGIVCELRQAGASMSVPGNSCAIEP